MEFDKSRVYTALNADELKVGSKVIVADNLACLKEHAKSPNQEFVYTIDNILADDNAYRFVAKNYEWALAYLVSEPEEKKLKWTDLKVGDAVRNVHSGVEMLITGIDRRDEPKDYPQHVKVGDAWTTDRALVDWEKVEE